MSLYLFHTIKQIICEHKYYLISFSTSFIFLLTTMQRYHRLRSEYNHYKRRHNMLLSITTQKQDEHEHLTHHINQLLVLLENQANSSIQSNEQYQIGSSIRVYDRGDYSKTLSTISLEACSTDEDEESDNDSLLQRLKLIKPGRLKTSSKQISNTE